MPAACSQARASRADLPIPGSPTRARTLLRPERARSRICPIRASSPSRPTTRVFVFASVSDDLDRKIRGVP